MSSYGSRTPTRSGRTRAEHAGGDRRHRTVADFCAEWGISRSTFYDWRAKGRAPRCIKLPNGDLRITQAAYDAWLATCEERA